MKNVCVLSLVVFCLLCVNVKVFSQYSTSQIDVLPPRTLEITYNKTSNIIFPSAIRSVDRGSKDVLVQKTGGTENILQVKAAREGFEETNLTVITSDGKLYSFSVIYASTPPVLNHLLYTANAQDTVVQFSSDIVNSGQARLQAAVIANIKKSKIEKSDRKFGITLALNGLYVKENLIYCRVELRNDSYIGYDIDQLRFFIRDKKKMKRTATQEVEVKPILVEGGVDYVADKAVNVLVYVLPKITIPDRKYLAIQLMEKNGGRHLGLKLGNRTIVKARPVDSLYTYH